MNKDVRLAVSFRGHRKRKKLNRLLGFGAEVYLIDLWLDAAVSCPEGTLTGWNEEDIADACNWGGNPQELVSALIESNWLEKNNDDGYQIHDWCEHQGWACKARARSDAAKKAADIRWKRKHEAAVMPENKENGANGMRSHSAGHTLGNAPSPSPLPLPLPSPDPNNTTSSSSAEPKLNPSLLTKQIFEFWKKELNHPRAKLDQKRKQKIHARLKDGYSLDDIKTAISGCKASPYHQGENTNGAVYDDIELICRDGKHVDQFIKLAQNPKAKLMSAKGRQAIQNGQTWLEMREKQRENSR